MFFLIISFIIFIFFPFFFNLNGVTVRDGTDDAADASLGVDNLVPLEEDGGVLPGLEVAVDVLHEDIELVVIELVDCGLDGSLLHRGEDSADGDRVSLLEGLVLALKRGIFKDAGEG